MIARCDQTNLPFVDACQMSTVAPAMGSPVFTSVTRPCMKATCASSGVSKLMVVPFGRTGWSSLQKGPKMAEAVKPLELFVAAENVMSSTSVHWVSLSSSRYRDS
jgi:hypothetical protein